MNKKKSIAVLMTCFDRVNTTLKCLDHLYNARVPGGYYFDVYLVDDKSPDGTGKLVKENYPTVNVIHGTGTLYWNGGMRLAWQTAAKSKDYDFYLWLNDDTFINSNAIETILNDYNSLKNKKIEAIISGALNDPVSKEITYVGRKKNKVIYPSGIPLPCDSMPGNLVFISNEIYKKVGILDSAFTHGLGDTDYSLQALKSGFKIYITSIYVGSCSANKQMLWHNSTLSFKERYNLLFEVTNGNIIEYLKFKRKHHGIIITILTFFKTVLRLVFPEKFENTVSKKKDIYLVITSFFPTPDSFRGPFIYDQCRAIERNSSYETIVFKPKTFFSNEQDYKFKGVKVYQFKTLNLPSNFSPGLFRLINRFFLKRKIKSLNLRPDQIKVVHIHSFNNSQYAKVFKSWSVKIKTIQQYHGLDVLGLRLGRFGHLNFQKKWIKRFAKKSFDNIDLHVGVSKKVIRNLKNYDFKNLNTYVLYNGVDKAKFFPKTGGSKTDTFTIGCIANFIPLKDQIILLKALKTIIEKGIKDIHIKFVGDGPTKRDCIHYVNEHNLEEFVTFETSIPHEDLVDFYNSIDLFVMSSYYEALGCVYLEAYSCGVPFIGVKNQGIEELIKKDQRDKWLIEKGDYRQLANLICDFKKKDESLELNQEIDINQLIRKFLLKLKKV